MTWKDSIIYVLQQNKKNDKYSPMSYREITDAIIDLNLRSQYGRTPENTVNANLTSGEGPTYFTPLGNGIYALTEEGIKYQVKGYNQNSKADEVIEDKDPHLIQEFTKEEHSKIIKSFGMFWQRDMIHWSNQPQLLGVQRVGAKAINFSEMRGIYLLYDSREVIYVGQAIDSPILKRLRDHTKDRLACRWDRFSWFGLDSIDPESGTIKKIGDNLSLNIHNLANALEGILIEGMEPRQNRREGEDFGNEYYQETDRRIKSKRFLSDAVSIISHES